ncbi:MAG: hypothetical protein ACP5HK_01935 [Acidilobus sp.]
MRARTPLLAVLTFIALAIVIAVTAYTPALAYSGPQLSSRVVTELAFPSQGVQLTSVSPLQPYGLLMLFTGSAGSYLALYNLSSRSYSVVNYLPPNVVPYLSPSGPYLCLSQLSKNLSSGEVYLELVYPNGTTHTVNLTTGNEVCEALAVVGNTVIASLENPVALAIYGESPDIVAAWTITPTGVTPGKEISLPPGVEVVDLQAGPRGMLYGEEIKYLLTPISNIYAFYPAIIDPHSMSLKVLSEFNQTLDLPSYEYLAVDTSLVSDSLLFHGAVFAGSSSNEAVSLQPILVYFNLTTYVLMNVSRFLPQGTSVVGAFWSPWGIIVSDAPETEVFGLRSTVVGVNYTSPLTFIAVWQGPIKNVTSLSGGRLIIYAGYLGGKYYLVGIRPGSDHVTIIELYEGGIKGGEIGAALAVAVAAAIALLVVRRQSHQ